MSKTNLSVVLLLLLSVYYQIGLVFCTYNPKTLVVVKDDFSKQQYSRFFKSLKRRGHKLDIKSSNDKSIQLLQYGVKTYENVILLSPASNKIGESLTHKQFLDYIDYGGNIMVGLTNEPEKDSTNNNNKPAISDLFFKLSERCGITIHSLDSMVLNHFNNNNEFFNNQNVHNNDIIIESLNNELILYNGIGMSIRSNSHLCHSLLSGDKYTYSVLMGNDNIGGPPDKNIISIGNDLSLIAALQTRNNARITFIGSIKMLSDKYFMKNIEYGKENNKKNGNQDFMKEISKWTFGEKGIIRATNITHYKIDDITINPNRYRIKDEVQFHVTLEEYSSECDCWIPFTQDDVQFEFVRLDPFVRQMIKHDNNGHYSIRFQIPDVFGVYKFSITYQRHGWSNLFLEELVSVRPYFHSEYERFLSAAKPYYYGAFSMIAGFIVFTVVFLFGTKSKEKIW